MNAVNGDLVSRIRQEYARADAVGARRPGRGRLVEITGASEHRVRTAKHQADHQNHQADHQNHQADHQNHQAESPESPESPANHQADHQVVAFPDQGEVTQEMDLSELHADDEQFVTGETNTEVVEAKPVRFPRSWPLVIIGLAGSIAVWSGWVSIGRMTGFGVVEPLPGIADGFTINTAVLLPIGIEAYGGYALRVWLTAAALSEETIAFAKRSALVSLAIGAGAQIASHLMTAAGMTTAPWGITMVIACVPVALVGLAAGLARLVANDRAGATGPQEEGAR